MKNNRFLAVLCAAFLGTASFAAVPDGYYANANGLKKSDLKTAMHGIIGTAKVLSYGSGSGSTWSGFYQTDRMDDGQVRDRYSYEKYYFPTSASASSASAVSGMNIEHSFPKSWWGGSKNQAYQDLFNLMPCQSTTNSSKGNYAMGKVTSSSFDNGCTKVGKGTTKSGTTATLWEPADEWKGDFARSYFYMVTAYSNLTWTSNGLDMLENDQWPTLQEWAYTLLLQWSREDPVDEIETTRNEAVYKIQGNRNPFVDFPNLAEYIWGDSINYAFSVDGTSTSGDDPTSGDNTGDDNEETTISETFATGLGDWTCVHVDGASSTMWENSSSYSCVLANAYSKGKTADDWLVSPVIDLTGKASATLTFMHATGFNSSNAASDEMSLQASTDYNGVPQDAQWTALTPTWPAQGSGNWTSFTSSGDIDLSAFLGQQIRIAFRYQSDEDHCWGWEIKNLEVKTTAASGEDAISNVNMDGDEMEKVYTVNGTYVGQQIPTQKGVYIVRHGRNSHKVTRR